MKRITTVTVAREKTDRNDDRGLQARTSILKLLYLLL